MSVEQVGPGGVSNSYGVRGTSAKQEFDNDKEYKEVFVPKDTIPLTATVSSSGRVVFDAATEAEIAAIAAGGGSTILSVSGAWADLADCTSQIQALINSAENSTGTTFVVVPNGAAGKPYRISQLQMKSGCYLVMQGGHFKALAALPPLAKMFNFTGVYRSGILGHIHIDGNKAEQTTGIGIPGQNESGQDGTLVIAIGPGASDIYIESAFVLNAGMEGLYVGPSGVAPKNIRVGRIVVDGANRNGIGITNCDGFHFGYIETRNTGLGANAALPKDGIDIEPNLTTDIIRGTIDKLVTHDNFVGGASFIGQILGAEPFLVHGPVVIGEYVAYGNGNYGLQTHKMHGVKILSGEIYNNGKTGLMINRDCRYLRVNNVDIHDNGERGISAALNQQDFASSDWNFDGCRVWNNGKSAANNYDGIRFDSDSASYMLSRVSAEKIQTYDDQATKTQRYGWSAGANVTGLSMIGYFPNNSTGNYVSSASGQYVEQERRSVATSVNPGSIAPGAQLSVFVPVTGISSAWRVESATPLSGLESGLVIASVHTGTDNIIVTLYNYTASAIDPAAKTWNFTLTKP